MSNWMSAVLRMSLTSAKYICSSSYRVWLSLPSSWNPCTGAGSSKSARSGRVVFGSKPHSRSIDRHDWSTKPKSYRTGARTLLLTPRAAAPVAGECTFGVPGTGVEKPSSSPASSMPSSPSSSSGAADAGSGLVGGPLKFFGHSKPAVVGNSNSKCLVCGVTTGRD